MTSHRDLDLSLQKKALRNDLRKARLAYCEQSGPALSQDFSQLAGYADDLLAWVAQHFPGIAADDGTRSKKVLVIASFKAKGREINPSALEAVLRARGHTLAWPRVHHDGIRFFADDGVPPFVPGSYGLLEPHPKATELEPDLILLPLVGFDAVGHRLGQGGGYYDRVLSKRRGHCLSVGLAFECQRVDELPVEAHDRAMQAVLTPEGLQLF